MDRHSNRITKVLTRVSIVVLFPISPSIILRLFAMERCNATRKQRLAIAVLLYSLGAREGGRDTARHSRIAERKQNDKLATASVAISPVIPFPYWIFLSLVLLIVQLSRYLSYWRHSAPLIYYLTGNQFTSVYAVYIYVFSKKKNRLFVGNGNFQVLIFEHFSEIRSNYGEMIIIIENKKKNECMDERKINPWHENYLNYWKICPFFFSIIEVIRDISFFKFF